jgi:hypothetical protein
LLGWIWKGCRGLNSAFLDRAEDIVEMRLLTGRPGVSDDKSCCWCCGWASGIRLGPDGGAAVGRSLAQLICLRRLDLGYKIRDACYTVMSGEG